jgi:ketosteroid isomerase-like protein
MSIGDRDYADWLERYRRAWIERDADAARRLFTEDALYREQAFQPAFAGRAAIRDYWARVTASQTSVSFVMAVDRRRSACGRGVVANLQTADGPLTLAGVHAAVCRERRVP